MMSTYPKHHPIPAHPTPTPPQDDTAAQITRINDLSKTARTTWISLLGYLAFVGVTLLGVADVDFFDPSRQTQLPLINVSIPTASFFVFAPILGAALYIYLHLYLLKLWDALANVEPTYQGDPISDHLFPWLINDLVLGMRTRTALRPAPLRHLSKDVTIALVFLAAPLTLTAFWWRSHPAHNEALTILAIAIPLCLCLRSGLISWRFLRARIQKQPTKNMRLLGFGTWPIYTAILLISWLRTEGGTDHYVNKAIDLAEQIFASDKGITCGKTFALFCNKTDKFGERLPPNIAQEIWVAKQKWVLTLDNLRLPSRLSDNFETYSNDTQSIVTRWPELAGWSPLAKTNLSGVDLTERPTEWRTPDIARNRFRGEWCARKGLKQSVCGEIYSHSTAVPKHVLAARNSWCGAHYESKACLAFFNDLNETFLTEWAEERQSLHTGLRIPNLMGRDLRDADLSNAFLPQANLSHARLEGADLTLARLEGANLRSANLQSAEWAGATIISPRPFCRFKRCA